MPLGFTALSYGTGYVCQGAKNTQYGETNSYPPLGTLITQMLDPCTSEWLDIIPFCAGIIYIWLGMTDKLSCVRQEAQSRVASLYN